MSKMNALATRLIGVQALTGQPVSCLDTARTQIEDLLTLPALARTSTGLPADPPDGIAMLHASGEVWALIGLLPERKAAAWAAQAYRSADVEADPRDIQSEGAYSGVADRTADAIRRFVKQAYGTIIPMPKADHGDPLADVIYEEVFRVR
jgi:hypothetical protein